MIHAMLPTPDLRRNASPLAAPHRRLMAAVLQTAVDDCRGSAYRLAAGYPLPTGRRDIRQALAYVASTDRAWPFSFENLCEALSLDAGRFRRQFRVRPLPRHIATTRLRRTTHVLVRA
jgi:hypothetical protein